jgi:hypothetical protein
MSTDPRGLELLVPSRPVPSRASPSSEREIREPVDLCGLDGRLDPAAVGFSRRPLHRCGGLVGPWGRRKRWHHWCVTTPREAVALTFADLDYLGLLAVMFVDLERERTFERVAVRPLGARCVLPGDAAGGEVVAAWGGVRLAFREVAGGMRLEASARGIEVDVSVDVPVGHETLGVVVPWSETRFQYTSKQNAMPAHGLVRVRGQVRHLPDAWACLDFGRGVWPARTEWNWASASGRVDGRVLGLNLGGRWTDGTGANENALCVDGVLHKIGSDVRFDYDLGSWRRPWRLRGQDVDLRFAPVVRKHVRVPSLSLCFGRFDGRVLDQPVRDLVGWAEEFRTRW